MRKITENTTKEEIFAPVVKAKEALAIEANKALENDYVVGDYLVQRAQAVRNAEALARAQMQYVWVLNEDADRAKDFLFGLVTEMNDKWSGRGNDSIRESYDAILQWARSEFAAL